MSDSKPKSTQQKLLENLINFKTTKERMEDSNIPEQKCQLKMACEIGECRNTEGKDYTRKEPEALPGWEGEPIFLCDHHAQKKGYLDIPEQKCVCKTGEEAANCDINCGPANEPDDYSFHQPEAKQVGNEWHIAKDHTKHFSGRFDSFVDPLTEEQLAAHKTKKPVINEVRRDIFGNKINPNNETTFILPSKNPVINEVDLMPHSAMEPVLKQIEQVFNYCKEQGITPDQLIERYTAYTLKETLPQAWTFEILSYCSSLGISTDQLIEEHQKSKSIIEALSSQIEFLGEKMAKKNSIE